MKIFLDTSSLFKLYHQEADSEVIKQLFNDFSISGIFLSEISKIEFASTVWKKVRTNELTEIDGSTTINLFNLDYSRYTFVQIDAIITEQAGNLITKYGKQGLRTLDSIQLATALSLKNHASLFITSDKLLKDFFGKESLRCDIF